MVWYNDRKAVIIPAHTGFCVYRRRPGANGSGMSGGHAIMTAKRSLYLRIPGSAFTAEDRAQMEVECPEDMP